MPDTKRGSYPDIECSDCGKVGKVCIQHWGPLVPPGKVGRFDEDCWQARLDDREVGRPVRPLGVMSTAS